MIAPGHVALRRCGLESAVASAIAAICAACDAASVAGRLDVASALTAVLAGARAAADMVEHGHRVAPRRRRHRGAKERTPIAQAPEMFSMHSSDSSMSPSFDRDSLLAMRGVETTDTGIRVRAVDGGFTFVDGPPVIKDIREDSSARLHALQESDAADDVSENANTPDHDSSATHIAPSALQESSEPCESDQVSVQPSGSSADVENATTPNVQATGEGLATIAAHLGRDPLDAPDPLDAVAHGVDLHGEILRDGEQNVGVTGSDDASGLESDVPGALETLSKSSAPPICAVETGKKLAVMVHGKMGNPHDTDSLRWFQAMIAADDVASMLATACGEQMIPSIHQAAELHFVKLISEAAGAVRRDQASASAAASSQAAPRDVHAVNRVASSRSRKKRGSR